MLSADTITTDQIRALRDELYVRDQRVLAGGVSMLRIVTDREARAWCESALNEMCHPERRQEARRQIVVFAAKRDWALKILAGVRAL